MLDAEGGEGAAAAVANIRAGIRMVGPVGAPERRGNYCTNAVVFFFRIVIFPSFVETGKF